MTIKSQGGIFGRNPTFNDVEVEGSLTVDGSAIPSPSDTLTSSDIGVSVQGYDADTAKYDDVTANFTGDLEVDGQLGVKTSSHWDASTGITAAGRIHTSDGTATGGFNYGNGTVINMGSMSSHPVQMIVGNSTKAIFETDGDLKIVSGNLVIGTSGKGIDFSATSGTGTSELFSDYEEGTWTPSTFTNWSTAPTVTNATYTKIGRQVTVRMQGLNGVASINAKIAGLPYTSASSSTAVFKNLSVDDYSIGALPNSQTQIDSMAAVDFTGTFWAMTCTYFT